MPEINFVVNTSKLCKNFRHCVAIDNVDLQIESGDIFGLIGANGSGKTTLLKILATVLKPTSGSIQILGYDVSRKPEKIRGVIGYLPESFGIYSNLKVWEYIDFFAGAYRIPKKERLNSINDVLELMGLESIRNLYIKDLSRGMKQRLGIARTIIHDPILLILDEPACGLDPKSRVEIREIIKELGNMGKTIIISSNILSDLAGICNKIGILRDGNLIFNGFINDILSQIGIVFTLEIGIQNNIEKAKEILQQQQNIGDIDVKGNIIKVQYTGRQEDMHNLLTTLVDEKIQVSFFHETFVDLEDVYLKMGL
ncbi:MAG: transporter ATP-binding protein [Candidatus Poribacteria bacterium]|nr:transporter ATP-binding protein [Candidatus Poribacteria bacterium]